MANETPTGKLILVPAVITLGVTLLRLVGELSHWSPKLFNPAAGGGGALVGIAWLVPVFGVYFALKLAAAGHGPDAVGPAVVYPLIGFLLMPVGGFAAVGLGVKPGSFAAFGIFVALSLVGGIVAFRGWPALSRTLLAYALAARIPVILVMLFAILGNWGTHYDVAPPNFPPMSPMAKWLMIGVAPQLTIWIWFTIAAGALVGGVAAAITRGSRRTATA
jgi:hypothetical protein